MSSASEQELGLADGADLDHDIASAVVRSLVAAVVAAYDAETFMIWEPVELSSESGEVVGKCSYSAYGTQSCEGTATTPRLYNANI